MRNSRHNRLVTKVLKQYDEKFPDLDPIRDYLLDMEAEGFVHWIPGAQAKETGNATVIMALQLPLSFSEMTEHWTKLVMILHERGYFPDLAADIEQHPAMTAPESNTGPTPPLH